MDATDRTIKGDIAHLKDLKKIEIFSLYSNPDVFGDICSLAGATSLRSLKFAFNPKITGDISCLGGLTKLETFAMTHTQISGDLSVFANMPNLKAIYVSGTNIKGNICALSNSTNLEELGISDQQPGNPSITGDLSCLDNLKKLRRVSLYNTNATNCEQFTKSHPNISQMGETESGRKAGGGCSPESLKTLIDVAQKYEQKIGKEMQTGPGGVQDVQTGEESRGSDGPPEVCLVDGQFIGEEACRALVDQNAGRSVDRSADKSSGPPEECIVEGKFIGEEKCRVLVDKTISSDEMGIQERNETQEGTKVQERETERSLIRRVIGWLKGLFK